MSLFNLKAGYPTSIEIFDRISSLESSYTLPKWSGQCQYGLIWYDVAVSITYGDKIRSLFDFKGHYNPGISRRDFSALCFLPFAENLLFKSGKWERKNHEKNKLVKHPSLKTEISHSFWPK